MQHSLTPATYDGVVSALAGNGELCTTLSPTGYHVPPEDRADVAHRTQLFVMAGRRRSGPQHPLLDLGSVWRTVGVDGEPPDSRDWRQIIEPSTGAVVSRWRHDGLVEETRSFVALGSNAFIADTILTASRALDVAFAVTYRFGEDDAGLRAEAADDGVALAWSIEDHLGDIRFGCAVGGAMDGAGVVRPTERGAEALVHARLEPDRPLVVTTVLHFADRLHYEFPLTAADVDAAADRHDELWAQFWSASDVVTGDDTVDEFRRMSLYALRCQATPWSIPASLSRPYWGGGAFHDELYPFFGLLSANQPELARRMPYFRLATLPQARQRARARGALYPWSSTEYGEERDPNGLWLTERFHLGQFAVCAWHLWLYERDRAMLDDLYPVLRDVARYFELNMLERDPGGKLRTRSCVDFDESVGQVTNGPFTISAAIACLECAAGAAKELGVDAERAAGWRALAAELRGNLPAADGMYAIPDGKPLHYSIVGPVFPFRVDVQSERARRSAAHIHDVCRSTRGWKSGFSQAFEGSNWMWTAGHLAIVHVLQGNADLAWDAVRNGPASAGPLLSPNEHVDGAGTIQVPWFTTGCGAWLYGLHAMFVQVDEQGTHLLPAVPAALQDARFHGLRAERGVLVAGAFQGGRLVELTAAATKPTRWHYRLPSRWLAGRAPAGRETGRDGDTVLAEIELPTDRPTSLLCGP